MPHSQSPAGTGTSRAHLIAHIRSWPVFPDAPGEDALSFASGVTALIGRNGTGKTRLMRLLAGEETWPEAQVHRHSNLGYLPQTSLPPPDQSIARHLGIDGELEALERLESGTGSEKDLALLNDHWSLHGDIAASLEAVGLIALDMRRPVSSLSGGEFTRLELARLQLSGASFLLLDEPTNHLDTAAARWVLSFIRTWAERTGGGILVVSHDRNILRASDRILELSSFGLTSCSGNYDDFMAQKDLEATAARRLLETRKRKLRQAKTQVQSQKEKADKRRARGVRDSDRKDMPKSYYDGKAEHAQNTMGKDKTRAKLLLGRSNEDVKEAEENVERFRTLDFDLPPSGVKKGQALLRIEHLTWAWPGTSTPLLKDVSLVLHGGDKLALTGPNGSGKSALLKLVNGDLPLGDLNGGGRVALIAERTAFLDQKTELIEGTETVMEAFRQINPGVTDGQAHAALARFLFRNDDAFKRVKHLSGGERMRTALAALLYSPEPPQLLILDEPDNHLDLDSCIAVARALSAFDGGILVVSHDDDFLDDIGVSERIQLAGDSRHPPG